MWRHGLLLRCKPSYLRFKDPAVSLIKKTSHLNPKIDVKNIFTNNLSLFPIRSYSKSVSDVLPEIGLEVQSVDNDSNKVGKSNTFVEGVDTVSENNAIDNVLVIKNNVIGSEELCLNGVTPILTGTDSERVLRHISCSGIETDSEYKASQSDGEVIRKDITIKNNENDLKELSLNDIEPAARPRPSPRPSKDVTDLGLGLGPQIEKKSDGNDQATPKDPWFCINDDEKPVRIYQYDQHQMIFEAIDKTNELTSEQWDELHKRVLSAGDVVNQENIQGSIMEKCLVHKLLSTGLSYLSYLSASAQEPNIATIGTFCKLAALFPSEVSQNDNTQNIITSLYDILRAKYPIFDAVTADCIIRGISLTKKWKDGLEILEDIRLTSVPSKQPYSALVRAFFDNDEPDNGWELISRMLQDGRTPHGSVYESWLQYCRRSATGNKAVEQRLVEKLLHFLADNDIRLMEEDAINLRLWFEYDAPPEADWNVEFTTVDTRGICQSCNQRLRPTFVTQEEFELLKSVFMSKTLVGSNVFLKTSPVELEQYQKFIKESAPYDVVIDGLNVGYSAGSGSNHARLLESVVKHFVRRSENVLVLGRQHMRSWAKQHMDFVYKNANVFFTDNLSQDDPFLLYATMYSGLNTRFISKDLMRGHAFLLEDPKLQSIFRRWQKQYQLQIMYIGSEGNVKFKFPAKYNTSVQCSKDGSWHIPYNKPQDSTRHQSVTVPAQWLCVSPFNEESNYDDRFENESYTFTNDRYRNRENREYVNNRQSQFGGRNRVEDSFASIGDESTPSRFGNRNYVDRGFGGSKESRFGRPKTSTARYDDSDDDFDEPHANSKPMQVNSDYKSLRRDRYVDQRFGSGRPASKMDDGDDSSDEEETSRSTRKQFSPEVRFKDQMLESGSKEAFKSNQTLEKPVRKEDP